MCLAYLAIWWAALFSPLRVKEDFHALNLDSHDFIPAIKWWTWIGLGSWLAMAALTVWESPSRMISLRPSSHAKVVPISPTLASVSRTPSGYGSSLLRAPISYPLSFRTTTPIPQCPSSLKQLHQHWPCTIQEEVVSISWGRGVEESGGAHRSFGTHLRRLVMLQKSAEQFCRLPHVKQPLQKNGF